MRVEVEINEDLYTWLKAVAIEKECDSIAEVIIELLEAMEHEERERRLYR